MIILKTIIIVLLLYYNSYHKYILIKTYLFLIQQSVIKHAQICVTFNAFPKDKRSPDQ